MPRLTSVQIAALPELVKKHNGNLKNVSLELGVSVTAIRKRVCPPKLEKTSVKLVAQAEQHTADAPLEADKDLRRAGGLVARAVEEADRAASPKDKASILLDAARTLIKRANGFLMGHRAAVLIMQDQRQVTINQGVPADAEALRKAITDELLSEVCPSCVRKLAGVKPIADGPVVEAQIVEGSK